jgi:hypothetical protein
LGAAEANPGVLGELRHNPGMDTVGLHIGSTSYQVREGVPVGEAPEAFNQATGLVTVHVASHRHLGHDILGDSVLLRPGS